MTKGINLMSAGGTRLTTQPTGGGDKKAGSVPRATGFMLNSGIRHAALGRNGRGEGRAGSGFISQTNQLAGIGSKRSMTIGTADGINKSLIKNDENSFSIINESLGSVTLGTEVSSEQENVINFLLLKCSEAFLNFAQAVWPEGFYRGPLSLRRSGADPTKVGELLANEAFKMGIFLQDMNFKTLLDEPGQFIINLNDFNYRCNAVLDERPSLGSLDVDKVRSNTSALGDALYNLWGKLLSMWTCWRGGRCASAQDEVVDALEDALIKVYQLEKIL